MENREIGSLLRSLKPTGAPEAVGKVVLAAGERTARRERTFLRTRRLMLAAAAAAAMAVVVLEPLFFAPSVDAPVMNGDTTASAPADPVSLPSEESLAGRAGILELKLARLKELAARADSRSRLEADLDSLEKELRTIKSLYLNVDSADKKARSRFQDSRKGSGNEENSMFHFHIIVDPSRSGARPG